MGPRIREDNGRGRYFMGAGSGWEQREVGVGLGFANRVVPEPPITLREGEGTMGPRIPRGQRRGRFTGAGSSR